MKTQNTNNILKILSNNRRNLFYLSIIFDFNANGEKKILISEKNQFKKLCIFKEAKCAYFSLGPNPNQIGPALFYLIMEPRYVWWRDPQGFTIQGE